MPVGQEVTATMRKGRPGPPESSPVLPGVSSVVSSTTSSVLSSPVSAAGVGSSPRMSAAAAAG